MNIISYPRFTTYYAWLLINLYYYSRALHLPNFQQPLLEIYDAKPYDQLSVFAKKLFKNILIIFLRKLDTHHN